ncbi:hypothetical protein [Janthinobacterium sp.]|uniref:hypothetical protein n=1 Tax=Janthinobacterium sp. TaxID=1871054 RepID=UPI0025885D40|nr:hypothetical protein [Janthinobacterium sp.]MCX7293601.1 hypothetical protein [Janthinobacterium sp.]
MTIFYSNAIRGFYPAAMRADYEQAGTWAADAVEVTPEDEAMLREAITAGAAIRKKSGGKWAITAPPPPPFAVLAAPILASARQARDAILKSAVGSVVGNVVGGITSKYGGVVSEMKDKIGGGISGAIGSAADKFK